VALKPRHPAALQRDALAVSNPRSRSFHHYLPKGAFAAKYGPSATTVNEVEAALRAAHLTVTSVSSNRMFVHFRGSVGHAESAFRTRIANYRMRGRVGRATTKPVSMPASVAPQVVSVLGLDTLLKPTSRFRRGSKQNTPAPRTAKFTHHPGAPSACSGASQAASIFGGLTDDQIAHAYGVDGLYKAGDLGDNQTIAIYELEPFSSTDLSTFDTCYFGKSAAAQMASRLTVKKVDGGSGTGPGSGESILDVDDVSGLAPHANIQVYEAPNSTTGAMDETNQIVQDDTANVVTTSWGFCELDEINLDPGYINVENQLYEQAALQGQSWLASSGDAGSDSCAYQSPQPADPTLSNGDPDSQPFVLSVGGTTITDARNAPAEQVWNDGNDGGGAGGGVSSVWGAPSWQVPFADTAEATKAVTDGGLSPCPSSADGSRCREEPDVSAQADEFTGAITVYTAQFGGWNTFGGTSSSAPLWAAMLADINASSGCVAGGGVGFVSPSLYAVASVPAEYAASFNDVTKGNNDVYDLSNGEFFHAHTGYDMASGLGSPKVTGPSGGGGLASYLCAMAAATTSRPKVMSVSPSTVGVTPAGSVTITGSGFTGAKALSIGGYTVPAANWSVTNNTTIDVSTIPTAKQAGNGGSGPQDGSGRALVSVTGSTGATSPVSVNATLLYVDGGAASSRPSVSGVSAYGGPLVGGNTVTVFGSGFAATGADQVTGVTIGGVPATGVTVRNPTTLTATIPPYASGTTACHAGDDVTHDVCQAQVVVSNANGASTTATIHSPYTGVPFIGVSGGEPLPGCVGAQTCEIVPATTEYDYYPAPTITKITTTSASDPTVWASEQGDTVATIDGSGFDSLGFNWVNVGSPSNPNHQDVAIVNITPTQLQVAVNPHAPSHDALVRQVTVQTLGGLSAGSPISYGGIPNVTAVHPTFVPDQGGGHVMITGTGFEGVEPQDGGFISYQYESLFAETDQLSGYTATSTTKISADTPQNNPGAFTVAVCTITFCSFPRSFKEFRHTLLDFYEPGDPVVTSLSKRSGPASGGTRVVIRGHNLSDAVEVDFGGQVAEATSAPQILTNGSNTRIEALAPPGRAGSTVPVIVTTVESRAGGHPSTATNAARFHYKTSVPSPPKRLRVKKKGRSLRVRWDPPVSTGGKPILRYRVTAVGLPNGFQPHAKRPPSVSVTTKNAKARSLRLRGLLSGWRYGIKVRAINKLGPGRPAFSRRTFEIRDPA